MCVLQCKKLIYDLKSLTTNFSPVSAIIYVTLTLILASMAPTLFGEEDVNILPWSYAGLFVIYVPGEDGQKILTIPVPFSSTCSHG